MDKRAAVIVRVVVFVALGGLLGRCGGCGDEIDVITTGGGDPAVGGRDGGSRDGGGSDAGALDASVVGCPQGCGSSQFCSTGNRCIDAGSCLLTTDCEEGKACDAVLRACVPGSQCGAQEVTGGRLDPNLFISIDRSCSMTQKVAGKTKWNIAVDALSQLTLSYDDQIRFGLGMFPDTEPPNCGQADASVPVAAGTGAEIRRILRNSTDASDPNFPDFPCVTNIDTGMLQASREVAFQDKTRSGYAVLITDGLQSGCNVAGGDNGTTQIIHHLRIDAGVRTFVVGFGAGVDPAQMNVFADAGGVPAPGDAGYYLAEDQASLDAVMSAIAQRTLSCTYSLTQVPPDLTKLYVFFDNTELVPRDAGEGWEYEAATNRVNFAGSYCGRLQNGLVTDLDIVFGCASAVIE